MRSRGSRRGAARAGLLCAAAGLASCRGGEPGLPPGTVLSPPGANHMQAWFAPDGRHVAYWAQTSDGWDLTVAGPDLEAARVVGTSADCCGPRPVWSPDGRAIAYPSGVQAGINVWLARTDGEAPRQLTQGAGFAGPWQWHPHGGRLVYFRSEAGGVAARFLDIATGASDVLPGTERGDLRIGWWSPDGTRIAYTVKDSRGLWTLWLADSTGGNQRQLTTEGFEFPAEPQPWSPDGREILYVSSRTGTGDIFVYPLDGARPRQLTHDVRTDDFPAWSPDGRWVVFRSQRGRQPDVWLVPAAGGTEVRVTDDPAEEVDVQWIPGTTRIAFSRPGTTSGLWTKSLADGRERRLTPDTIQVGDWDLSRDRTQVVFEILRGGDASDLAVAPVAGGPMRVLMSGSTRHRLPKWSPDGTRIAFGSNRSGNWDIWVVDAGGGDPRQMTDWPSDEAWESEWTADGSGVYFMSLRDADPIGDLWLAATVGGEPTRVTTIGMVWDVVQSPATQDLFLATFGREGRVVLNRRLPNGRLETLWDRWNVIDIWARGVMPSGDSIMIDVAMPDGSTSSVLVPVRGGEARPLFPDGGVGADWSADGLRLLHYVGATSRDLAVLSLRDGSTQRLTQTPENERLARWGPDYQSVVFLREVQRRAIVTVDVGSLIGR